MPRVKVLKSIIASRAKWEANRQKPTTWNPSRRREDFRQLADERPKVLTTEFRDARTVYLDTKKRIIKKVHPEHNEFANHLIAHLKNQKFKFIELVPVKSLMRGLSVGFPRWVQRYYHRPSLYSLKSYFYHEASIYASGLSQADKDYCKSLLKTNPKISEALVSKTYTELECAFSTWRQPIKRMLEVGLEEEFNFAFGSNFIVFGLTKDGKKLKVGLVDA